MVCCDRHSGAPQGELCATQHRHLKKKELKNPRGVQTRNICPKINDKSTVLLKRRDARGFGVTTGCVLQHVDAGGGRGGYGERGAANIDKP